MSYVLQPPSKHVCAKEADWEEALGLLAEMKTLKISPEFKKLLICHISMR